MAAAFFQVRTEIRLVAGGAELAFPAVLQGHDYQVMIVKDGGEEALIRIEGPGALIDAVAQEPGCKKLTEKQAEALRQSYPAPRLKQRLRAVPVTAEGSGGVADEQGQRIVDTYQTIRAGFHLIDILVAG